MIDYINELPIAVNLIPSKLKELLTPINNNPMEYIELACAKLTREDMSYYMSTVTVSTNELDNLKLLYLENGVVSSGPNNDSEGKGDNNYTVGGYNSLISSWSDGSFFTYNLSDKVWMTLGLTPRCLKSDNLTWDDLKCDITDIACGELSTEHYFELTRQISWKMRNDYLRKYLWHIGHAAVRTFWYEEYVPRTKELESLIGKEEWFQDENNGKWYDIRLHVNKLYKPDKIIIEVSATVIIALPELCPEKTLNDIVWPDTQGAITRDQARALGYEKVYFSDDLLKLYEGKENYIIIPDSGFVEYKGRWAFRDCRRFKRNYITMPYCKIFEGINEKTIVQLSQFAVSKEEVDAAEDIENIAAKTIRFKDEFLLFGKNLCRLSNHLANTDIQCYDVIGMSKEELDYHGWFNKEQLFKMAKVAPLNMNKDDFLSRCKTINEFFNQIPKGYLQGIVLSTGIDKNAIKDFGSIKLLHGIKNVLDYLSINALNIIDFRNCSDKFDWNKINDTTIGWFVINDLRQIDAHDKSENPQKEMEKLGFDVALCRNGYGKALDFIYDEVIKTIRDFNNRCFHTLNI